VDEAVGSEHDGAAKGVGNVMKICDFSAGFFDEENACGGVPALEAEFPEAIEAAGGNAGQIQCGGTVTAHAVRAEREIVVVMNVGAGMAFVDGKAGAEKAGGKRGDFRDGDFLAVEHGTFAACGSEKFFINGIVDDAGEDLIALREGDGDTEARVAVGEICGAVEGIDMPAKFGVVIFAKAFFGGDCVRGEIF
jgi:hypothetical protein